jgi:hypothetical protein
MGGPPGDAWARSILQVSFWVLDGSADYALQMGGFVDGYHTIYSILNGTEYPDQGSLSEGWYMLYARWDASPVSIFTSYDLTFGAEPSSGPGPSPVPEPCTLLLLGGGLAGLAALKRKKS